MAYDITQHHPLYDEFMPAWTLMRDAYDGEESIKAKKETYLPMKSGHKAITDVTFQDCAYKAYQTRAEFPELVAPTVRGSVGIMLKQPAKIELPAVMEPLREKATLDGLTLDNLHRRICVELMTEGRYGLMPGVKDGVPYLAGYVTESITNWDKTDNVPTYLVLDESAQVRDLATGKWGRVERFRECYIEGSVFGSREWVKVKNTGSAENDWEVGPFVVAETPKREALKELPFVFIGCNDLLPEPDDVPLYGLARIAVSVYRLDADYKTTLHCSAEPTPWASGYDNPEQQRKDGKVPSSIGASVIWLLPPSESAGFLEFSGASAERQQAAIDAALNRAVMFGAQVLTDNSKTAESGDAKELRYNAETSLLRLVAINSAAGLEKALKNIAVWIGANPDEVTVTPNLEFFDKPLTGADVTALVEGWLKGAYSYDSLFWRIRRGGVVPPDRTKEEEQKLIGEDDIMRSDPTPEEMGMLPPDKTSQQDDMEDGMPSGTNKSMPNRMGGNRAA